MREIQILALVAAGETTPEVSKRLGISENTVKSHLTAVYKKTGSVNRVQAVRHYLDRYTTPPGRNLRPKSPSSTLIQQQIQQLQDRLDQLAPAAREAERVSDALDALRAIEFD